MSRSQTPSTQSRSQSASRATYFALWWPFVAMAAVGVAVWLTYKEVERTWRERVKSELSSVVAREAAAVQSALSAGKTADPKRAFGETPWPGGFGEGGNTYVFDAKGKILWHGPARDLSSGVDLTLRNPGGNTVTGFSPLRPRERQPLTHMAESALSNRSSSDLVGYRDFRGVPVVGVWRWLSEADVGVAAELPIEEAYAGLHRLFFAVLSFFALLVGAATGIFTYSRVTSALRRRLRRAERLGQYRLEEKIGQGGMGKVYRASHALLKRPTAIKLIADDSGETSVRRFEREVQVTSQLTHPNTIAVYDFGRTPDGAFYYAMEYLEGLTLDQIVASGGPLPPSRVVHLIRQVCGSLAEAHRAGVIHRDIKPSNVIVCARGGIFDFVKVLDFGLARRQKAPEDDTLTQHNAITGTPHYMSPESMLDPNNIDARSDLYAVGALAYYLLTADTVFHGDSFVAICASHMHEEPEPPSRRAKRAIDPELEQLVLSCLEKDRNERPADADLLSAKLRLCCEGDEWTQSDAKSWWEKNGDKLVPRTFSKGQSPSGRVLRVAPGGAAGQSR